MEEHRRELISYVFHRSLNIIRDSNTFTWAKLQRDFLSHEGSSEISIGRGNILVGVGLFLTVVYLAKILWILEGKPVVTNEQEADAKGFKKGAPKTIRNLIENKRAGDINELSAFKLLLQVIPNVLTGIEPNDLDRVYDTIRNKSVHMISPGGEGSNTVTMSSMGPQSGCYATVQEYIESCKIPVFSRQSSGHYICKVELMNRDVRIISKWMCDKIESGHYAATEVAALKWIKDMLSK